MNGVTLPCAACDHRQEFLKAVMKDAKDCPKCGTPYKPAHLRLILSFMPPKDRNAIMAARKAAEA